MPATEVLSAVAAQGLSFVAAFVSGTHKAQNAHEDLREFDADEARRSE